MRLALFMALGGLAVLAGPAQAADTPPPKLDEQNIRLSPVGLPIVVDGRVINYVFVTVKVDLTPSADLIGLQSKEPAFRDALVREAHRTPFVLPGDYNHLDVVRLKAAVYRDAVAITGPGVVRAVEVLDQTAQHFIPAPKPNPPVSP